MLASEATVEGVLAAYRGQIVLGDAVIAGTSIETAPAWWPSDARGGWRLADLGEVLLHTISETACHAGHLDPRGRPSTGAGGWWCDQPLL